MSVDKNLTPVSSERSAASIWRYRASYSGPKLDAQLLENEFLSDDVRLEKTRLKLSQMLLHSYDAVSFYRKLWFRNRIRRRELSEAPELTRLPTLSKSALIENIRTLQATTLLSNQQYAGYSRTSGTTGQPVEILHSNTSMEMFAWLKQRELRWFRFDPQGSLLSIRPGEEIARNPDGSRWPDGKLFSATTWPYLHAIFETGPATGFTSTSSLDQQLAVLEKERPDYLLTEPATLENLAMQPLATEFLKNLKGLQTVSQTLTADMRLSITKVFGQPIFQNYGLNEIGLVASMCQYNRYHVHEEHCHVELITEDGHPAKPGERGRLLVTTLTNSAMPLIRYETEDTAERADDQCPCGRSLMSFIDVEGRYRRLAQLPSGSYQRFKAIQATVNAYARSNPGAIKRYQVCQLKSGEFHLLIQCNNKALDALTRLVPSAFNAAYTNSPSPPLFLKQNASFRGLEKRKFQIFYSELMPE